jgi:hypothetical protein
MRKNPKSKRPEAERASEWYAVKECGCVITRRACRTKWQSVDMFCCDVVGKRPGGSHVYIQATAGQNEAVRQRRRKLDSIPWHPSDEVLLLQLVHTENPANARSKLWFFRVHRLRTIDLKWLVDTEAYPVPKEWFKSLKNAMEG